MGQGSQLTSRLLLMTIFSSSRTPVKKIVSCSANFVSSTSADSGTWSPSESFFSPFPPRSPETAAGVYSLQRHKCVSPRFHMISKHSPEKNEGSWKKTKLIWAYKSKPSFNWDERGLPFLKNLEQIRQHRSFGTSNALQYWGSLRPNLDSLRPNSLKTPLQFVKPWIKKSYSHKTGASLTYPKTPLDFLNSRSRTHLHELNKFYLKVFS